MINNLPGRQFGVEIEFCTDYGMRNVRNILRDNGIDVHYPDWEDGEGWKLVEDGSVDDGWELVSPILSGPEGFAEVAKALEILTDNVGAWIDFSCGLHVHVNANDLSTASIANAMLRYDSHSHEIDKVVHPQRLDNRFCLDISEEVTAIRRRIGKISQIKTFDLATLAPSRYKKLNLAAYLKHGTLEFRLHEGALSVEAVTNWIAFCVQFIEDSICDVIEIAGLDTLVVKEDHGPFANLPTETQNYFKKRAEHNAKYAPEL